MDAGALDRRVTLRKFTESQSASGAVVLTPEVVATVWARKMPAAGTETFTEEQRLGWSPVLWHIRYLEDALDSPTVKWDLMEGLRVYDIMSVRELGRREGWELTTRVRAEDQVA